MKLSKLSAAVAIALTFSATGAFADPVSAAVPPGFVDFSDNSAERLINRVGGATTLDVGDSLRGILSIDNITGSGPQVAIGAGTGFNELTGLFQVIVLSKTFVATIGGLARYDYTFGFDPAFGQGAGVIGVLYDDPAKDFARLNCGTFAACEATATGGSVWATIGFGGTGFWSASAAVEDTSLGSTLALNTPLGNFGMGLNFITNNTGYTWNDVQCDNTINGTTVLVDVCGQGGILATGRTRPGQMTNTPFDIFDNVDLTANRASVPEPGSIALVGLAFLGLGLASRRKKSV